MPRLLFGYSFLYYSMYQYCSKVWSFSKDWPEFYAALIMSVFLCFLVGGAAFLSIALFGVDFLKVVAVSEGLKWMPEMLRGYWHYLLIVFFNVYYFVMNKKWESIVKLYSEYPDKIIKRSHWLSGSMLLFVAIFYLGAAFFLDYVR